MNTHPSVKPASAFPLIWSVFCLLLLGGVLPWLCYDYLPQHGIETLSTLLSAKKMALLLMAVVGSIVYWQYICWLLKKPQLLVYFFSVIWPIAEYLNNVLLPIGINLHWRPLLVAIIALPAALIVLRHLALLLVKLPHFKFYLGFMLWLALYYVFNNAHFISVTNTQNILSENNLSLNQFLSYSYGLLAMGVGAIAFYQHPQPQQLFNHLNKHILWVSSILAIITIAAFPFNQLSTIVDGFHRSMGLFSHPNPFAHHMGILLLYLMGLFYFYKNQERPAIPPAWFITSLTLNGLVFMMALSKTAIAIFSICALIFFLMNVSSGTMRRSLISTVLLLGIILPIALLAYQWMSDISFLELLEARINKQESLNWRMEVWNYILAQVDSTTLLVGNGFTAANQLVFQINYQDKANGAAPLVLVHNGYVALLYDLGLLGYLIFIAALSQIKTATTQWLQATESERILLSSVIVMSLYFLIVCDFDEMTYMFDGPTLMWTLTAVILALHQRHNSVAPLS